MKREKFLWPLTQSHHRGLVLAKHVREKLTDCPRYEEQARVLAALEEVGKAFEEELCQHFWDEERILGLYEVRMGTGEPLPERIRKDHRRLEILGARSDSASLLEFADLLTSHIHFEEEELFPGWERALGEEEKAWVGVLLERSLRPNCAVPPR
jgi:hemerythrin-like domain-containing protein